MDEEQKQILDNILADFNAIGTKAMMELSNGNGQFTIARGAWTVSLDVEGYLNHQNESKDRVEALGKIVNELSERWHEQIKGAKKKNED